jgi:asparagine synthetase A
MKNTFDDYKKSARKLYLKIFGANMFKDANTTKLTPFKWKGLDYTHPDILVAAPTIKQRFENIDDDNQDNALDEFINAVFLMGYNQCLDTHIEKIKTERDRYREWCDEAREDYVKLLDKIKKEKEN